MKEIFKSYDKYIFKVTTATHLAFARICLATFCLLYITYNTHPDYPNSVFYERWTPNSIFYLFPTRIPVEVLTTIRYAFKTSLVFMLLGLGTRFMTVLSFIFGLLLHGYYTNFSNEVYHHSQMAIFSLFILSLGKVNDSISVDRIIKRKPFINLKTCSSYGYPLSFLLLWVVAVYFSSGVQKLYYGKGLSWALSQNLRLKLINTPKLTSLGELLTQQPNYIIYFFALCGLLVEILAPVAAIYRKSICIFVPLWIILHLFVHLVFGGHISFFSQVGCYLALIPFIMHSYDERDLEINKS